jgi:DNA mismatch repair protein MutS2
MQDIIEKFEFQKIRDFIAGFTRSEVGKENAESLAMFSNADLLVAEQAKLREMMDVIDRFGRLPIEVSSNLEKAVTLARKGGVLSIEELEKAAHDVIEARDIVNYFKKVTDAPLLLEFASKFPPLDFIEKDIHKVIAPDMSIYDSASPKLKGIRVAIAKLEGQMKKKLGYILDQNKVYLSDTTLTMKNGHYVLPVANAYKNKVKGIVQDVSGSGETTFIEPELIVELNNQMYELRNDEREEIHRLLKVLSEEIASSGDSILLNNQMIGTLDFLQAKALYGASIKAKVANFSKEPLINLKNARHPLIDKEKVVANDFSLTKSTSLIVISGPNAGGKTVALKTLGLLVLMNECGLAIPADPSSSLSFFNHIYVDIGDSQSLSDNLSTFSGHMANISSILSNVGGKDLVLLDEVGTGTSPKEGEAIAFAVITYLLKKCAFTMVSSHFEGLKAYALSHKEITNASMVFDEANLLPTYKLKMGLPGESYGLVVAKRFGLPSDVLTIAQTYLAKHEETSVTEAIKKLGEATRETEDLRTALEHKEADLAKKEAQIKSKEEALAIRQEHYLSDVEEKKNEMLQDYVDKMDDILHSVQRGDVKLHEVIKAKGELDDLRSKANEEHFSGPIALNDYVNVPSAYSSGRVTRIDGKKVDVTTKEGFTLKTTVDHVVKVEEPPEDKTVPLSGMKLDEMAYKTSISLELNLIGQHVDEAKLNLDKYLDECRVRNFKLVRIIHGWGSGVLRNLVHNYCDTHKNFIDSYEGAGPGEGGGGATIIHLK